MKGIAGGVAGGGFYDPPLTIEEGGELVVLPGAELEGRLNNNGTIIVFGRIGEVTGNPPTTPSTPTLKPWPAFPQGIPLSGTASPLCRRARWLP